MDEYLYQYHYENMLNTDPDVLVGDLELETADIMARFPTEVRRYIEENFG